MMDRRELALEASDFARDYCGKCEHPEPLCPNGGPKKCLISNYIVSTYKGRMYTRRNDYPITDWRHYVFEGERDISELHTELRRNR